MTASRICKRCGRTIPPGQVECSCATEPQVHWPFSRETTLLFALALLVIFFVVAGFASQMYHNMQKSLAQEWQQRGDAALSSHDANTALRDFRTALVYSRGNDLFELRLAQALVAAGQYDEAQSYLLNLWEHQPGDGTVNLELARLAGRKNKVDDAKRYYHNAIYGIWTGDAADRRRQVGLEFSEFLLDNGARVEAQAELMGLAADLPEDPALHAQVGGLLLRAQAYPRALEEFQVALRLDRKQEGALAGAGTAAYHMGNYQEAERYLTRAVRAKPNDAALAQMLETSRQVLSVDPFETRLPEAERRRRVVQSFRLATKRLTGCAKQRGQTLATKTPVTPIQKLHAEAEKLRPRVTEVRLRRNPDDEARVMDLVFRMEAAATQDCGPATGADLALELIARQHGGSEQ